MERIAGIAAGSLTSCPAASLGVRIRLFPGEGGSGRGLDNIRGRIGKFLVQLLTPDLISALEVNDEPGHQQDKNKKSRTEKQCTSHDVCPLYSVCLERLQKIS